MVKDSACNAGDAEGVVQPLGWEDYPGGENSKPLQYSCLENPMDRGAQWTTVHGVIKSEARLSNLACIIYIYQIIMLYTLNTFSFVKYISIKLEKFVIILFINWQ